MKSLYTIIVLALIMIGIERMTLPPTTDEMIATAKEYSDSHEKEIPPKTFKQDGCTLFPDSILGSDFREACLAHDIVYWNGGTKEERKEADHNLKLAVAEAGTTGYIIQKPVYLGVRLFGDTWLTKYFDANWGFGWNE
jgi:hypothetical protein